MSMSVVAHFFDAGVPKTGLSPTVDIYKISDSSQTITAASMTEIGGGFYKYDFAAHDALEDYAVICDGTVTLSGAERYAIGEIRENKDDLIDVINTNVSRVLGLVHENFHIDNTSYDSDGNLTSARLRIYSDPASVGTDSDVIGTYVISSPGSGAGKFTTWSQVKV